MKRLRSFVVLAATVMLAARAASLDVAVRPEGRGFAPVNGTRLFYEVSGSGEPIVLIHGGQLDSRMWDGEFTLLSKEFRVLRYDVRGYGGSPRPEGATYSDSEDLRALLDYVGMPKAHLVGLSLGGRIALDFAPVYPERVLSLTLVGPGLAGFDQPDPEGDARWGALILAAHDGPEKVTDLWLKDPFMAPAMENPRLAPRVRLLSLENAHEWIANPVLQKSPRPKAAERLKEIAAPTLLVLGDRDVKTIKATIEKLEKDVPGAKKVVVPGAGHMVNMEKPEEFDHALLGFLRGLKGKGRRV